MADPVFFPKVDVIIAGKKGKDCTGLKKEKNQGSQSLKNIVRNATKKQNMAAMTAAKHAPSVICQNAMLHNMR